MNVPGFHVDMRREVATAVVRRARSDQDTSDRRFPRTFEHRDSKPATRTRGSCVHLGRSLPPHLPNDLLRLSADRGEAALRELVAWGV